MKLEKISTNKFKLFESSRVANLQMVLGGWMTTSGPGTTIDRYDTGSISNPDGFESSEYKDDNGLWGGNQG